MAHSDQHSSAQVTPPQALEGTHGVVWLANEGRRTTTQAATNVHYTLCMTSQRKEIRSHPAILPPAWEGTLAVARHDSSLQPHTEIVLTLDDGRQVAGYIRAVRGIRAQHADVIINGWVADWA